MTIETYNGIVNEKSYSRENIPVSTDVSNAFVIDKSK